MIKFHLAQGVGYATMTIVFWLDIYYCIIIAWTLYYLIATLSSVPELPWRHCGQSLLKLNTKLFSRQVEY